MPSEGFTVVAVFRPVKYRVEKLLNGRWQHVGDYDSATDATARAADIPRAYSISARVLEVDK